MGPDGFIQALFKDSVLLGLSSCCGVTLAPAHPPYSCSTPILSRNLDFSWSTAAINSLRPRCNETELRIGVKNWEYWEGGELLGREGEQLSLGLFVLGINLHCLINLGFVWLLPRFLPFSPCSLPVSLPCPIPTSSSHFFVWLQLQTVGCAWICAGWSTLGSEGTR